MADRGGLPPWDLLISRRVLKGASASCNALLALLFAAPLLAGSAGLPPRLLARLDLLQQLPWLPWTPCGSLWHLLGAHRSRAAQGMDGKLVHSLLSWRGGAGPQPGSSSLHHPSWRSSRMTIHGSMFFSIARHSSWVNFGFGYDDCEQRPTT